MMLQATQDVATQVGTGATVLGNAALAAPGLSVALKVLLAIIVIATMSSGALFGTIYKHFVLNARAREKALHDKYVAALEKIRFEDYALEFPTSAPSFQDLMEHGKEESDPTTSNYITPVPADNIAPASQQEAVAFESVEDAEGAGALNENRSVSPAKGMGDTTTRMETKPPLTTSSPTASKTEHPTTAVETNAVLHSGRLLFQVSSVKKSDAPTVAMDAAFQVSCRAFFIENLPGKPKNINCKVVGKEFLSNTRRQLSPAQRLLQTRQTLTVLAVVQMEMDTEIDPQEFAFSMVSNVTDKSADFVAAMHASDTLVIHTVFQSVTTVEACAFDYDPSCQEKGS